jgi:hypothetical protein
MNTAAEYHEECILKVKKDLEEKGYTVYRNGKYDILSKEEYNDTMPLALRLTKLSADLRAVKNGNVMFFEIKTEDIKDAQGNLNLSALQLAYFINQRILYNEETIYCYFQRDGDEKGWHADDLDMIAQTQITEGHPDAREYIESAFNKIKNKGSI